MNELIFFVHIVLIVLANLVALHMGKETLVALACTQAMLACFFVTKQIVLFGCFTTCTDAFIIGNILSLNLLQEYYDKKIAYKTAWIEFFILMVFTIMAQIQTMYLPCFVDTTHQHFAAILRNSPRIMSASFIAFLASMNLEISLYQWFKRIFSNHRMLLNSYLAIIISQIVDSLLFGFLGLYGIVHALGQVILISIVFKIIATCIAVPLICYAVRFVRKDSKNACSL